MVFSSKVAAQTDWYSFRGEVFLPEVLVGQRQQAYFPPTGGLDQVREKPEDCGEQHVNRINVCLLQQLGVVVL